MENKMPELNADGWNLLYDSAYGTVLEKKDGSVIVTGSWDGKGVSYQVCYKSICEPGKSQITYTEEQVKNAVIGIVDKLKPSSESLKQVLIRDISAEFGIDVII